MVKRIIFIAIGIGLFFPLWGQSEDAYTQNMKTNIALLDRDQSPKILKQLVADFEGLAQENKSDWLPYYYASLSQIRYAFEQKDKAVVDKMIDKAETLIQKAKTRHPDEAEMLCLESLVATARIWVNPYMRALKYGSLSNRLLEKAIEISPENPHPYLLLGQNKFHAPSLFGGGKSKALPYLNLSLHKFASFHPKNELFPTWGKELARNLQQKCSEN